MTLSINLNPASSAARAYASAQASGARASARLGSGLRINSAADDAAGLAVAVHMTSLVRGLAVGARNAQDAISLTQTAEGALGSLAGNVQRLRELAVQSANGTNSVSDRAALQSEAAQLVDEIDRVARSASFNGQTLLDGRFGPASFQVGANAGQTIDLAGLASMRTSALGNPLATTAALAGNTLTAASTITGAGQLLVNGIDVWRGVPVAADARSLAAAINAAGIAGVAASAAANVAVGTYANVGANGEFSIDGQGALTFRHGGLSAAAAVADTLHLVNGSKPNLITDGGFEDGTLPASGYVYGPADQHPWSFNSTGVTGNGSGFTGSNGPIPEGQIAAFVQTSGVLSQTFNVANGGSYDLSFQMVQRANYFSQSLSVIVDGQQVALLPGPSDWTPYTLSSLQLGAGSHTISFAGSTSLDGTVFLDDVKLTASGPVPSSGVVASDNGSGVTLTAADGGNIRLNVASGAPQIAGLGGIAYGVGSDGITYSHVDLDYSGNGPLAITGSQATALGLAGAPQVLRVGNFLDSLDLSTAAGAVNAIDSLDQALATIDGQRSVLGAAQNRLGAAVASAQSAAADANASRSRIMDADFGTETTALVRSQILQQAAMAMIAQANGHRSDVLRLLLG